MSGLDDFLAPGALLVAAAAPLVGAALWLLDRRRARRSAALVGPRHDLLSVRTSDAGRRVRGVLFGGALVLAGLAAAQPLGGLGDVRTARGADVVVCLDVSRSMLASDVAPTRLARAQREIRSLAAVQGDDRLALVVFAGEARAAVPLTRDRAAVAQVAADADPASVARGGTDLGSALGAALAALPDDREAPAFVVLLTDGEDNAGRGLAAARACAERGVVVHCAGLGSPRGAKIAVAADTGPRGGGAEFLRDRAGAEVVSALDVGGLRAIAAAAGGAYVEIGRDADALARLHAESIAPAARRAFERSKQRERENRFQWALLPAFGLWLLDLGIGARRRR